MKKWVYLVVLLTCSLVLWHTQKKKNLKSPGPSEKCLSCHARVSDPDPSHPIEAFGCHVCHLGNPYSLDKERAHATVVKNPASLEVAERTCGKTECHPKILSRVKNSLMATNAGIIAGLMEQWGEASGLKNINRSSKSQSGNSTKKRCESKAGKYGPLSVKTLLAGEGDDTLALDHYEKMCGSCHLWKPRKDLPGEIGERGGGCSNCHLVEVHQDKMDPKLETFQHPQITTKIPATNCTKCHNRSARIGLSYFGRFESAGYGTPYEGNGLSNRRLSGQRFYLELPADVHHQQADMVCIDCHTATGLMGDGKRYDHMEDQVDIACEDCHRPRWGRPKQENSLAQKLVSLNRKVPPLQDSEVPFSQKQTPLYNIRRHGDKLVLYRKLDGQAINFKTMKAGGPHEAITHGRLKCQACHSAWTPQCYGCHELNFQGADQRSWLTGKRTPGRWMELRSYLRFAEPTLGIGPTGRIEPFAPGCQVFYSEYDMEGEFAQEKSFTALAMAPFDPHTTRTKVRTCEECHMSPKTLGMGQGQLIIRGEKISFLPLNDAARSGFNLTFSLDAFVSPEGIPLQRTSRSGARPFDRKELLNITRVALCLPCHDRYEDKIYQDFSASLNRYHRGDDLPCLQGYHGLVEFPPTGKSIK